MVTGTDQVPAEATSREPTAGRPVICGGVSEVIAPEVGSVGPVLGVTPATLGEQGQGGHRVAGPHQVLGVGDPALGLA